MPSIPYRNERPATLAPVLLSLLVLTASASAQPQPGWVGVPGLAQGGEGQYVKGLAVFDDGSGSLLHVGGKFDHMDGQLVNNIAQGDGYTWSPLAGGLTGALDDGGPRVDCLKILDLGAGPALYVGGDFQFAGAVEANGIVKWDGQAWSPIGPGLRPGGWAFFVNDMCVFDDGTGPALFVGGWFRTPDTNPASALAKWDGSTWSAVGGGLEPPPGWDDPVVGALCVFDDGRGPALYIGGVFVGAGGVDALNIARWDGSTWEPVGAGLPAYDSPVFYVPRVNTLAVLNDGRSERLYVGGGIEDITAGLHWSTLAYWDGLDWRGFGYFDGYTIEFGLVSANALSALTFDDGTGPALFMGGTFQSLLTPDEDPVPLNSVAKVTDAAIMPLDDGLQFSSPWGPCAYALCVFDDGFGPALFVGGKFTHAGTRPAYSLARWGLLPADLNCDGYLNGLDIDPFVLAITDSTAYELAYPDCDLRLADLNRDGTANYLDIEGFVQRLVGLP